MDTLITALQTLAPLPDGLEAQLQEIVSSHHYEKHERLLRIDRVCPYLWCIQQGLVGSFYEQGARTICSGFVRETEFILPVTSFLLQQPSKEAIIALEDTRTQAINYEQLRMLLDNHPSFQLHIRILTTRYYQSMAEQWRAFHHQRPIDKYRYLLEHQPDLILRVSNTHLASYMGMRIETLSRLKGRM